MGPYRGSVWDPKSEKSFISEFREIWITNHDTQSHTVLKTLYIDYLLVLSTPSPSEQFDV